jgi:type III secretory pathway component EscR
MFAGFLTLLLLFGPAAAGYSYCVSFYFKSPSLVNIALIVSGFLIAMGASMSRSMNCDVPKRVKSKLTKPRVGLVMDFA